MWDENGGKGDVRILIGVHEVDEWMRVVVSSTVVTGHDGDSAGCYGGDDWCTNPEEGRILVDSYE